MSEVKDTEASLSLDINPDDQNLETIEEKKESFCRVFCCGKKEN